MFLCPCHEGVRGSRGVGTLIPNCSTGWKKVVTFMPSLLYLREETLVSIGYKARSAAWLIEMF
jgi:hypothetical protein